MDSDRNTWRWTMGTKTKNVGGLCGLGIKIPIWCWLSVICLMLGVGFFLREYDNRKQVAGLEEDALVMKAAFVQLDEVSQFTRLFPRAAYSCSSFIATPNEGVSNTVYICKLPAYTIVDEEIAFHGKVRITANKLVFGEHSARGECIAELTIKELTRERAGKSDQISADDAAGLVCQLPEIVHWSSWLRRTSNNRVTGVTMIDGDVPEERGGKRYWRIGFYENQPTHTNRWETFLVDIRTSEIFFEDNDPDCSMKTLDQWRKEDKPMERISDTPTSKPR
jgi:hypothetical protein